MLKAEILKPIKTNKIIPIILVIGLLIMRYPFLIGSNLKLLHVLRYNDYYYDITYLLTAIFIFYESDNLVKYNIGLSTILIFILVPLMNPIIYLISRETTFFSRIDAMAVILAIALVYKHPPIHREKIKDIIKWFFISVIIGIIYAILLNVVYGRFSLKADTPIPFHNLMIGFYAQLQNAALSEEPLFRGFIWGYLREKKWKEQYIWLFQAGLFCLGHIYYLPQTPIYFIGTFVCGLVFGLFVWKSKSISTSMIVHTLTNCMYR